VCFFTALYLQVITHFSGWKIAAEFLPMSAAMVGAGWLAGRLTAARGPRPAMLAGCLCAGAGMFAVSVQLDPNAAAVPLAAALALVGFGLGLALVAVTAGVLAAVPATRSGMAASTVNTSRQVGGVFAVAILGAVVNGRLVSELTGKLISLGVPGIFRALVINAVTRGGLPANAAAAEKANPIIAAYPTLVQKVLNDAIAAFGNGVHTTLLLAGAILLAGGAISLFARAGAGQAA
jgi:MFS family permease